MLKKDKIGGVVSDLLILKARGRPKQLILGVQKWS